MIHIALLPFTNTQTRTIKYTSDTGYMYMDLSFLVYFPLSNLKLYLILVFVMFFYCSNAPVKVNPDPPPPHPGTCGALVGLYRHIGSSLSPQYVGDSRVFLLLS